METAKDILTRHAKDANNGKEFDYSESWVLKALEEVADKAWEAAEEWKDEQLALNLGLCPQPDAIDKSTFMKSLFP